MAILVKKITDYRKIENHLVEVHPKTEASQVVYNSGGSSLDDAVVNIANNVSSALTATVTDAGGSSYDVTLTHPAYTAYSGGISSQTATFGGSFDILSVKGDATGHITEIASAAVTMPSLPDANASSAGIVKLSDTTSGTAAAASGKTAATPKAVADALTAAKNYADGLVTAAMVFKGTVGTGGNPGTLPTSGVKVGDAYRVAEAGTYAGHTCEVGDLIIATSTTPEWTVVQNNVDVFAGATSSAAGSIGMVPTPAAGDQDKVLTGGGTWVSLPPDVDEKVKTVPAATSKAYIAGTVSATTATGTMVIDTGVYLTTSAGELHATNFDGKINNHTVNDDVPANAEFTDTKVVQTADSTTSDTLPILAKNTTSGATVTDTARFATTVTLTPSTGTVTATTFSGGLAGNASTATEFSAAKTVELTGDVTGSKSSKAGWSIATTLSNTGVTSGSYGPSADASPDYSSSFSVPYITVDAKGRITSASTKTITLPADTNVDTKVTQTVDSSTNAEFALLAKATSAVTTVTDASRFAAAITMNPSTGKLSATEYNAFIVASAAPTDSTDISKLATNGVYTYVQD